MAQSTRQKILSRIVFGIYFGLLIWLILFKFATDLSGLPHIRSINWIPFYYAQENGMHRAEVLYNILVFVPLGIYVQLFHEKWRMPLKCLAIFLTSLLFEVVQFVFAIGASDVTDLIGNTIGGLMGIVGCILLKKIFPRRYGSLINGAGLVAEIGAIGLLILLWLANG